LRSEFGTDAPRSAGVFVDAPPATIRTTVERAALDLVQLHGAEPPALVRALHPCAFKALRPRTMEEARRSYRTYANVARALPATHPNLLLDAHHPYQKGGTGRQADLAVARWLASRCRLLLAGGLAPENVADVVAQIRPWGVDVSSGVESSKGIKDHARVRALIEAVRTYDQSLNRQQPATENRC
jgi:phosphoribosylanthranilate isomerase